MYMQKVCDVTQQLLKRYGSQLMRVERLSEHTYRATLRGGELVHAVEMPDGSLRVLEV